MAKIRPFRLDDIPGVVALRRKSFRHSERPAAAALGAYFEHVFFRNPWRDETLPSLVYVDPSGRPVGFLGVVPRRATFRGEALKWISDAPPLVGATIAIGLVVWLHPDRSALTRW